MAILRWLVLSIALASWSGAAHTAEDPPEPQSVSANDLPDAIDALMQTPSQAPPTTKVQPIDPLQDRISVASHQIDTREFADAEPVLTSIIADIEQQRSRYDPSLVVPLTLLGDSLNGQGKYQPALDAYGQADHIIRITDGLHSTRQIDVVYREADTLASMGKIDKANDRQEYAYDILVRQYGPFGPALVPGLFRLAAWYDRTFNLFGARGLYERAVQILSRTNGENDPSLVPALRGLAKTYRDERFPPYRVPEPQDTFSVGAETASPVLAGTGVVVNRFGTGENALVFTVRILEADPNAKPLDVALAELDLADWYLLFEKQARAVPVYVHARQVMRERAGMSEDEVAVYFGRPTPLYLPLPPDPPAPPLSMRGDPTHGFVEVGYSVSVDGMVSEVKTLASTPEGPMDTKVRRGIHIARFRPQFDGDNPVPSTNQNYRHTFVYYPRLAGSDDRGAAKPTRAAAASPSRSAAGASPESADDPPTESPTISPPDLPAGSNVTPLNASPQAEPPS